MPNRLLKKSAGSLLTLSLISFVACSESQTVSLTAEDFRFTPNLVRVTASLPLTLTVYNAGREVMTSTVQSSCTPA